MLPEILDCREFVNADEIAKGLSPFQPEKAAFESGRIMLNRIRELIKLRIDFAFETTLSTKSYVSIIQQAKLSGYRVILIFFWLESIQLAQERVKTRVSKGGHNIPADVIERRYRKGLQNLNKLFIPIVDGWIVVDNSSENPIKVAEGNYQLGISVFKPDIWSKISAYGD